MLWRRDGERWREMERDSALKALNKTTVRDVHSDQTFYDRAGPGERDSGG